ncbi:MAG TPA: BON domain-containing protein [Candidatus Limnocylindrales bacterium]|nr:BON domain-containing protein [Candidatus Limnocylindrales bacterium]
MTDPRRADTTPLNPPDVDPDDKRAQLEGTPDRDNQDATIGEGDIDNLGRITDVEVYEGELEAGVNPDVDTDEESLDLLTSRELRAGETNNPDVAAEEGEAWVPPVDPPVVADRDAPEGVTVAAGFGSTAMDEPFDADHHSTFLPADDEVSARVREALLADSRTSRLAESLGIETAAGVVTVRGSVQDIEDGELIEEVASVVTGVTEVRDETDVPGL